MIAIKSQLICDNKYKWTSKLFQEDYNQQYNYQGDKLNYFTN